MQALDPSWFSTTKPKLHPLDYHMDSIPLPVALRATSAHYQAPRASVYLDNKWALTNDIDSEIWAYAYIPLIIKPNPMDLALIAAELDINQYDYLSLAAAIGNLDIQSLIAKLAETRTMLDSWYLIITGDIQHRPAPNDLINPDSPEPNEMYFSNRLSANGQIQAEVRVMICLLIEALTILSKTTWANQN